MEQSAILVEIVFSSALFFFRPVQLLETGYDYTSNELIENDRLYDDLKCAYLFSGLTRMRLVELLIDHPYEPHTNLSSGNISHYSHNVKYQIASLYTVNVKRMGGLWLVHLYNSMVSWFYENSKNKAEDYRKMIATTKYVIDKLRKNTAGCRKGNSFDNYDNMIKSNPNPTESALKNMLGYVDFEAKNLLSKNNRVFCTKMCNSYTFKETLKIKSLFMENLGALEDSKADLMYVYNVQVDWSGTAKRLEKSWVDARTLDWATDNLENIKSYYTLSFSFLKIIMFQLTLKHITYLQDYEIGSNEYVHYAHQWYGLVGRFGRILSLTEELQVNGLLTAIYNLSSGIEKTDSVVSYVFSILVSLCAHFGCVPAEPFRTLDNKEFQIHYKSSDMNNVRLFKTAHSRVPIEYNSLENTRLFLLHLSRLFENVDFGYIRLLIGYIDEIKIENDMERFENLHLHS